MIKQIRNTARIFLALVALSLIVAYASSNAIISQIRKHQDERAIQISKTLIDVTESLLQKPLSERNWTLLDNEIKRLSAKSKERISVILPTGQVVADSRQIPKSIPYQNKKIENIEALENNFGYDLRYSDTYQANRYYVSKLITQEDSALAIIRISSSEENYKLEEVFSSKTFYQSIALLIGFLALLLSIPLSLSQTLSYKQIRRQLERQLAKWEHKKNRNLQLSPGGISKGFYLLTRAAEKKVSELAEQIHRKDIILESMGEGVLVIDTNGTITNINHTAAQILEIDADESVNTSAYKAVRHSDFQKFLDELRSTEATLSRDIAINNSNKIIIQTKGATLKDSGEGSNPDLIETIGYVIVFSDVTNIRRLENLRRDFVANVSHELKTPITSVKGFLETALDEEGKLDENITKYLQIAHKHSERLLTIVEELLSLARIESHAASNSIEMAQGNLVDVAEDAISLCHSHAESKGVTLKIDAENEINATFNKQLIEQAVTNLIENAIEFSDSGKTITIKVYTDETSCIIDVIDEGCGIQESHLPRLFERFYVTDKSRSRERGGTGLGLSIVKHIALAHSGDVSVSSAVGKGSTFSILLANR